MNTGLSDWLKASFEANPEHAHILTDDPTAVPNLATSGTMRHKANPSIIKIAKGLPSFGRGESVSSPSAERNVGNSGLQRSDTTTASPTQQSGGGGMDKMQARGKDIFQSASVLGGKGIGSAKGWLAKGKKKLRESQGGSDKVD